MQDGESVAHIHGRVKTRFHALELISPEDAMGLAITVGYRGWGGVAPNPMVGCVIVDKEHRFLAAGAHRQYGGAHAEVDALNQVTNKKRLEGGWVYVTLEPCSHHGQTPPCAHLLAKLPISGVTYLVTDPNPQVNGAGAEILRLAGKRVVLSNQKDVVAQGQQLAEVFLTNHKLNRPFVALKVACTLDGCMARRKTGGQWITGAEARELVHELRAGYDAIVVGKNTLMWDDPQLNIRHNKYPDKRNKVIILDSRAEAFRPELRLLSCHKPQDVIWAVGEGFTGDLGSTAQVWPTPVCSTGQLDLSVLLKRLYEQGVKSLFLEGGSGVYGAFLNQGLVDRCYIFFGPQVGLGDAENVIHWTRALKVDQALRLAYVNQQAVGQDWLLTGRTTPLEGL